jgi:threonine dehydratase
MPQTYVKKILDARIYDLALETPVDKAPLLSQRLKNQVLLKREDLQPVFSFKLRGAYNKLRHLSKERRGSLRPQRVIMLRVWRWLRKKWASKRPL